jgi:hypothetical protein
LELIESEREGTHDEELFDTEALDGGEIRFELELGEDNDLVAAPGSSVRDDNDTIDVAHGEQA